MKERIIYILALGFPWVALAHGNEVDEVQGGYMMHHSYLGGFYMGWVWLFIVVCIFFMFWLFARQSENNHINNMDVLKNRLATGEIDQKQYDKLKKELRK